MDEAWRIGAEQEFERFLRARPGAGGHPLAPRSGDRHRGDELARNAFVAPGRAWRTIREPAAWTSTPFASLCER